jgi:hypothetical protein
VSIAGGDQPKVAGAQGKRLLTKKHINIPFKDIKALFEGVEMRLDAPSRLQIADAHAHMH